MKNGRRKDKLPKKKQTTRHHIMKMNVSFSQNAWKYHKQQPKFVKSSRGKNIASKQSSTRTWFHTERALRNSAGKMAVGKHGKQPFKKKTNILLFVCLFYRFPSAKWFYKIIKNSLELWTGLYSLSKINYFELFLNCQLFQDSPGAKQPNWNLLGLTPTQRIFVANCAAKRTGGNMHCISLYY